MKGQGLKGKPSRQAHHSLGGWAYQLWHSLYTWLTLQDHQILYLEGAEDFDLIDKDRALSVQVKKSRKKISLGSQVAKTALANYLDIRRRNLGREIHFRFLTTAGISIERGKPFGPGTAGISLWNQAKEHQESSPRIRAFLLKEVNLPHALRDFLEHAEPSVLEEELILPFKWETSSRGSEYVERAVEDLLITHGDRHGISAHDSVKLAGNFLRQIFETATSSSDRSLTRAQFIRLFEELTTERVSRAELITLRQSHGFNTLGLTTLEISAFRVLETVSPIQREPPPPLPALAQRKPLLEKLRSRLKELSFLLLTGSAGKGKTTLAKKLAAMEDEVFWADCTSKTPNEIRLLLARIRWLLQDAGSEALIVLDDINLTAAVATELEPALGSFVYALREAVGRHIRLVFTSQRALPARLMRAMNLRQDSEVRIPEFAAADIRELAICMGCPKHQADRWKDIILIQTDGHPQLVHARLVGLRDHNWPSIKVEEILLEPEDVKQERREARSLLLETLPPEHTDLLYYLSVFIGGFRRDHAIAIGDLEDLKLRNPADVFEALIGPWVESVGSGYFRVSALIKNAGADNWSRDRTERVHRELAEVIPSVGALTLREVGSIISHSLAGGAEKPLAGICISLLRSPMSARKKIGESISWVAAVRLPKDAIPGTPLTRCLFRAVQFRVAAESWPDQLASVINAWKADIGDLEDEPLRQKQRLFLAGETVGAVTAGLRPRILMDALLEFDVAMKENHDLRAMLIKLRDGLTPTLPEAPDLIGSMFPMIAFQCRGAEEVAELIASLEELDSDMRQRVLAGYKGVQFERALFVDHAWIEEVNASNPNWQRSIVVLQAALAFAKREKIGSIEASAYAALAAVYSEHLADVETAHRCLDQGRESLGNHPILENQRAAVLFEEGRYLEALEIWRALLAAWRLEENESIPDSRQSDILWACRNGGISAAKLGSWREAGGLFLQGARASEAFKELAYAPGFFADAAFCYWRAGAAEECIASFENALLEIEVLPDPARSLRARILSKVVGHVLLWIETHVRKGDTTQLGEPTPGLCSRTDHSEKIAELVITPLDMSWLHLAKIEAALLPSMNILDRRQHQLLKSQFAVVRMFTRDLQVRWAFRSRHFEDLPAMAAHLAREHAICQRNRTEGREISEPDTSDYRSEVADPLTLAPDLYVAAIIANYSHRRTGLDLVREWQEGAAKSGFGEGFGGFLEGLSKALRMAPNDAISLLANASVLRDERLLAALRVALEKRLRPEDRFYSHLTLFDAFMGGLWWESVGPALCTLITRQWLKQLSSPATLRTPKLTAPAIAAACGSDAQGMVKVAGVLLSVLPAVNVSVSAAVIQKLRSTQVNE